jgi:signal transduction histidine kinase
LSVDLAARVAELESALREISERHRVLAAIDAATQPLVEPREIMQATARLLSEHLDVDRCAYANVIDQRVFDITGDWPRGVPSIVGRWDVAAFGPGCVAHMHDNTPYVVTDADTDPRIPPDLLEAYRATTIRAVICVPLHKRGVFTAAMAVHSKVPRTWTPAEIELVSLIVARCWETLERAATTHKQLAAERALAQNRARLEYAVRLSGFGFWYCDLPFDELRWDDRVKDHFFLPPDARVTIDMFYAIIHPDDRERTRSAIERSIANHTNYDIIYRTVGTSGAVKYIRAIGGAAYGTDGAPQRFDGVTHDVTQLREHDRKKDEFIATLAHELRNPLAPVRSGVELLRTASDEQRERVLDMMDRQLVHLVRMVDDLLDISRVTLGKITLVTSRTDVRTVVDSALETARAAIEANGLQLVIDVPDEVLALDADPTRIAQVIANLLSNASKYTPRGGTITVSARRDGTSVHISVADTGIGIPGDKLPTIFEMFTQLHQTIDRAQGGLGIGLTLARRLVDLHGGTIAVDSPGAGQGATFTVSLPLASSTHEPAIAAPVLLPSSLEILVVDDNVDAAETLGLLLESRGHRVRLAHTGYDTLDVVRERVPDIVLLDIGLPGSMATRSRVRCARTACRSSRRSSR